MNSTLWGFWDAVIAPHVARARPAMVALVGAGDGALAEALLSAGQAWGGVVHVADAAPACDVAALRQRWGDRLVVHVARPAEVLGLVAVPDLLLVDGDPNYYAVQRVLTACDAQAGRLGRAFPLTVVGASGWPAGRRDGYLDLGAVPEAFRHPHERAGLRPGQAAPGAGGMFGERWNAVRADAPRCGVMTAIEDFAGTARAPVGVLSVPLLHGLSVIYPAAEAERPDVRGLLAGLTAGEGFGALAGQVEEARVAAIVALGDARRALEAERYLVGLLRERLQAARAEVAQPAVEPFELPMRAVLGHVRRKLRGVARRAIGRPAAVETDAARLARLRTSPVFDAAWYLRTYPDVAAAGWDAAEHYDRFGAAEGRDPGPYFSTAFYLAGNADVAEASVNPLLHYLADGGREGRDPSPYFSSAFYLEQAPDVREAGVNPLEHFLTDGAAEGRRARQHVLF